MCLVSLQCPVTVNEMQMTQSSHYQFLAFPMIVLCLQDSLQHPIKPQAPRPADTPIHKLSNSDDDDNLVHSTHHTTLKSGTKSCGKFQGMCGQNLPYHATPGLPLYWYNLIFS